MNFQSITEQVQTNYERFYEDKESYNNSYNQSFNQSLKETSDSDEQFLNDFISEMLPTTHNEEDSENEEDVSKVNNAVEEEEEEEEEVEEENNSNDEDDFEQQQQLNKYLAERSVYRSETENLMSRILPKIEEVENENDESRVEEKIVKPVKSKFKNYINFFILKLYLNLFQDKQCLTNTTKPASISVHMTRTALLRENKIKKQNKISQNQTGKKRSNNLTKTNENPEKQQRIPLSNYNMPTKSSSLKTSGQGSTVKKLALTPSNRINLLKSSKSTN